MDKIIGDIAGVPNPKTDWEQNDERKADYLKNKPDLTVFANAVRNTEKDVGVVLITDALPTPHIKDIEIFGNSIQMGTPTLETPYEIKSVVNPTVWFTYGGIEKSVTFDGITLRGVKSGKDRIYTENGKVYLEQNIGYSKPSTFATPTVAEWLGGSRLYKTPSGTIYSQANDVMANIGMHRVKSGNDGTLHWYITRRSDTEQAVYFYAAKSSDWSTAAEAHQWIINKTGMEFEYQYLLKTPKVKEITGDSATTLLEILKEIKEQEFEVYFYEPNAIVDVTGSVTYNQDTNKAIENLKNAIISLGGNV